MASQSQWPTTGVGQDFSGLAIQARADQTAIMQSGNQCVVLQQQGFRPIDVCCAYAFHIFEALIVGVGAIGKRGRRLRCPGHRFDLGRHEQQEGADGDSHQQYDMTYLHALTPADRCW
ncbi:hypothetical protein D3C86_1483910 [compost metagenome]